MSDESTKKQKQAEKQLTKEEKERVKEQKRLEKQTRKEEKSAKEQKNTEAYPPAADTEADPTDTEVDPADAEADPAADTEALLEWRQFIQQELERLQNRVERNPMPKEAASSDQSLASIMKKIPIEHMIESAVHSLIKAVPTPTKKSK